MASGRTGRTTHQRRLFWAGRRRNEIHAEVQVLARCARCARWKCHEPQNRFASFCHHGGFIWKDRPNRLVIYHFFGGIFGFAKKPVPGDVGFARFGTRTAGCWMCIQMFPCWECCKVRQGAKGMPLVDVGRLGLEDWGNDQERGVRPSPSDASKKKIMRYCSASVQEQGLYKKLAG